MADDIVTRLRELAIGSLYGISIAPFEHYNAAADEIERLRAAIRHLYFNIGACYGDNCDLCELVLGLCDDEGVHRA